MKPRHLFSIFQHEVWIMLFSELNPYWKPPIPTKIIENLLYKRYNDFMADLIDGIKHSGGGLMRIEGATNRISKSFRNVIVHIILPLFIEYLTGGLKYEKNTNIVAKIKNSISRLNKIVGMKAVFAFVSDSCNEMREVARILENYRTGKWAYGCAANVLNNLSIHVMKTTSLNDTVRESFTRQNVSRTQIFDTTDF